MVSQPLQSLFINKKEREDLVNEDQGGKEIEREREREE